MKPFRVHSDFAPGGDQPEAIAQLAAAFQRGDSFQTLLGITGSGKSATIAWTIEQVQRPTLVLAPNKALAAQLANEFRQFFPENRVEYFVSYYDYYQPEAYIPQTRHLHREGIDGQRRDRSAPPLGDGGAPHPARCDHRRVGVGDLRPRVARAVRGPAASAGPRGRVPARERDRAGSWTSSTSGTRSTSTRGKFRVRATRWRSSPPTRRSVYRIEYFGDEVERILQMNPVTGEVVEELGELWVYPATHYVTSRERLERAIVGIEAELADRLESWRGRASCSKRSDSACGRPTTSR